jgi:uncharacterized protein (DUF1800 family)
VTRSSEPSLAAAIAVTRFGLGARPGELDEAACDPQGWLLQQVRPEGADQPHGPDGSPLPGAQDRYQALVASKAAERAAGADGEARKAALQPLHDSTDGEVLARAVLGSTTPAPFRERWALFWANHLSVSTVKGEELMATAAAYEREAVRPHVFGRFSDMLAATSAHPAMLMYLDQPNSVGPNSAAGVKRAAAGHPAGLNENLGREIMELHTLGADAGYSQADVTEFARALTGWSVGGGGGPVERQGLYLYKAETHEPGERRVFGRHYPAGGEEQARAALADFARSPHTGAHLARKLATHFVADTPPPALVRRLDHAYRESDGDLGHLASVLVQAPETWTPQAAKLKTPYEHVLSIYRASGYTPTDPKRDVFNPLGALGQRPLAARQPNGWSDQGADWAAPDAVIKRMAWARNFAGDHPPSDPAALAVATLGARLTPETLLAVQRAETRPQAATLLFMSPDFQRR